MTKYLVSGYVGFDNFGDEAIASLLARHLKTLNPEKITWISSNPDKTKQLYDVNTVGMLKFSDALKECDVLISGGGSLLQDITSLKSLVYYVGIITLAILLNKKVYIFAQGFTPFRTKIGEFMTKFVLKRCHHISVRDKKSQELLQKWGINSERIPDPVYGIESKNTEHKGVGVQLRSFPTLTKDFLESLAENIKNTFPNQKIDLLSLQDNIDLPVIETFAQMLSNKGIEFEIFQNLSVENAVEKISSLEYLIAMRFHACLVGAKTGVKVLGINYDEKVKKLSSEIGFPLINLDIQETSKISEIFNVDTKNYNLPQTYFPDFS